MLDVWETARSTAGCVTAASAQLRNHLFPENGTVVSVEQTWC